MANYLQCWFKWTTNGHLGPLQVTLRPMALRQKLTLKAYERAELG